MSLTYEPKGRGRHPFNVNEAGSQLIGVVNEAAGVAVEIPRPGRPMRRAPYAATAAEARTMAAGLNAYLHGRRAVRLPESAIRCAVSARAARTIALRWQAFLERCEGYEAR